MNKPKSTTTWQERADAVGALVKPSSSAHDNQTKQSTTTTSEGLVTQAELQALVNGKPTYHYANQKHDLDVMLACVNAEIENYWKQPSGQRLCAAPFYFERAAILYRKAKLYADEIRICETWISIIKDYSNQGNDLAAKVNLGPSSQGILKRLPKARELLKKHQDQ